VLARFRLAPHSAWTKLSSAGSDTDAQRVPTHERRRRRELTLRAPLADARFGRIAGRPTARSLVLDLGLWPRWLGNARRAGVRADATVNG
jgi:hypothetical protein